jgi:GNAT superfamily N-acetyltransferase
MPELDSRNDVLEIRGVGYDHADAATLIQAVQQVYLVRYGGVDATPVDPSEFAPPSGAFMVGYVDGVPVTCGGWRLRSAGADPQLRDGDVELKRMFVADSHRGRGYARLLLAELERAAAEAGGVRIVLETGTRQPEAVALYLSSGYGPMPRFGLYRDSEDSLCLSKHLTGRTASSGR